MVLCTRRGCGAEFLPPSIESCRYHSGAPVFHEGLKSWSCCKDINKPVFEFDQFLSLPGCQTAQGHSTEKQYLPIIKNGKEVSSEQLEKVQVEQQAEPTNKPLSAQSLVAAAQPTWPEIQDSDPSDVTVPKGTACKRTGCNFTLSSSFRDRASEKCLYHRGSPIFHQGSKGWSCCKRRVLDFNDFLQIEPCTTSESGHLFIGQPQEHQELIDCRMDHYETPNDVRLSVYAKGVDKEKSTINFTTETVGFHLSLPSCRKFIKTLKPFDYIIPNESSFTITKFKVDLVLVKQVKGQSWPCLENGDKVVGYGLTFGRDKDK